jgi:two-component system chemotaxis sensor kinase CheA
VPGGGNDNNGKAFLIVIGEAGRKFGLVVDKLVGEDELVIKPLDESVVATDLVSGASVLGDGTVVLILNLGEVIRKFARVRPAMATVGKTTGDGTLGARS